SPKKMRNAEFLLNSKKTPKKVSIFIGGNTDLNKKRTYFLVGSFFPLSLFMKRVILPVFRGLKNGQVLPVWQ
ncbi:MAG: hypothetical protein IKJ06_02720, partial [Clostridia bacterium]|nr:hypothetical protein [Clostridia bacterium]